MIKAVLIDDEPLARTLLVEFLQAYPQIDIIAQCTDGFEGVKAIQQHKPDLIFLDIQMPKINGFEMLELIDIKPAVIFTTAFDEYAIKAFDTLALDYLLKPFSQERFNKAVEKFLSGSRKGESTVPENLEKFGDILQIPSERIVVKYGGNIKILPYGNIFYLEGADDYVKIVTAEGSYLKNRTLSYFESLLSFRGFIRVHRSFIVNGGEITRIDPYEKEGYLLRLRSGAKIPVSKSGFSKLKLALGI